MIRTALALLLLTAPVGCDDPADDPAASDGEQATTRLAGIELPTPFTGTMEARHTVRKILQAKVTYTIAPGKIRREAADDTPLLRELPDAVSRNLSGVIVDLDGKSVVLYRQYVRDKYAVKLSLDDYEKYLAGQYPDDTPTRHGFSTHWLYFAPEDTRATVAAETSDVDGLACEHLTLTAPGTVAEADHCTRIVVDRRLLKLVEPGLPKQVTGFPCRVRIQQTATSPASQPAATADPPERDWVRAAVKLVDRATKVLTEAYVKLTEINPGPPPEAAFDLPEGFKVLPSLGEFTTRLAAEASGGGWDD